MRPPTDPTRYALLGASAAGRALLPSATPGITVHERGGRPRRRLAGGADPRREGVALGDSRPLRDWLDRDHRGRRHLEGHDD